MISGNVPQHLLVAARTGFLTTATPEVPAYDPIAALLPMDAKSIDLVDLGASPMPTQNKGKPQIKDFIEKTLTVKPLDWDITVFISHNAVQDDKTGELDRKVRSAGENFQLHISNLAFKALNDGDATTNFGACYDGLSFFNNSHIDKGAEYSTAQDNLYDVALGTDLANFETVKVAARKFRQDQGEFVGYNHNILVVSPELERTAAQITANREDFGTDKRAMNPYAGQMRYLVSSQFDSTAWALVAGDISVKPIIIAMREEPNLQSAWFDPEMPDGGRYYFKFYARYNHFYGDWRTAILGKT